MGLASEGVVLMVRLGTYKLAWRVWYWRVCVEAMMNAAVTCGLLRYLQVVYLSRAEHVVLQDQVAVFRHVSLA